MNNGIYYIDITKYLYSCPKCWSFCSVENCLYKKNRKKTYYISLKDQNQVIGN